MEKRNQDIKSFINLILSTKISKTELIFGLMASAITTLATLAVPLLTKNLVDGFSAASLSVPLFLAIGVAFIVQAVIGGFSLYLLTAVGQKIVASLRERMWTHLLRLPVSYFDNTQSGEAVSRIINDTTIVRGLVSRHFPQFVIALISIFGAVTILFIMDWKMTLMLLIAVPFTLVTMIPLGRRMSKISQELLDETASFMGNIQQTIGEIRLMKSSTAEQTEEAKGKAGIRRMLNFGLRDAKVIALIGPIMQFVMMFVAVLVFGYGGIQVTSGAMTIGTLVAFLLYLFQVIMPITNAAMFFTEFQRATGATKRIIEIFNLPIENEVEGLDKNIAHQPIHFSDVSFAYKDDSPVLNKISFTAHPGEVIAFVGPSGAGKTTLFGLIERFYEPTSGTIKIGDTTIKDLSMHSWRSQIGYVAQEHAMMAGTIRENLCYGLENPENIDDERLWEVSKLAYADEFIKTFPDGLDTEIGERGIKLSGGQKQRIAIARAYLRDPKILMLDEATSNLDSESEHVIQEALNRLMVGRTTLIIAHRLSTIVHADKIIFIEDGKVTGSGTHQELYQAHPMYHKFAEQQLTEFSSRELQTI